MIINSLDQLNQISLKIIDKVNEEDCILLFGEIGVGKTTLVRALINNLQNQNKEDETEVVSPTFNIIYEYEIGIFKIMHYDLYRLKNTQDIKQLDIFDQSLKTIRIIEWPELIQTSVKDKLEINFKYVAKENERDVKLKGYGKWKDFQINAL